MAEGDPLFEARALLRTFLKSDWKSCDIVTDRLTLFASRDPAIRAQQARQVLPTPAPAPMVDLCAPHLGTLVSLVAPGTRLEPGAIYGRVAVLDEERDMVADQAGILAWHHQQIGALVEFGQPLVSLALEARA
jgi:biotin carboxyl carrier protein